MVYGAPDATAALAAAQRILDAVAVIAAPKPA
jgi:hypothetical protein